MSTAAEILVALSGLAGISAGAHFTSITGGSGDTVFASQMTLVSEVPQRTLYVKPKRASAQSAQPKAAAAAPKGSKYAFLVEARNESVAFSDVEEMWLIDVPHQTATLITLPNEVFTARKGS